MGQDGPVRRRSTLVQVLDKAIAFSNIRRGKRAGQGQAYGRARSGISNAEEYRSSALYSTKVTISPNVVGVGGIDPRFFFSGRQGPSGTKIATATKVVLKEIKGGVFRGWSGCDRPRRARKPRYGTTSIRPSRRGNLPLGIGTASRVTCNLLPDTALFNPQSTLGLSRVYPDLCRCIRPVSLPETARKHPCTPAGTMICPHAELVLFLCPAIWLGNCIKEL